MSAPEHGSIRNVALVSEQRSRVRDLSGFRKKNHQVPDECNDRTQAFVGKIAAAEIGDDLDTRFAEFRKYFRFKRVDLKVSAPENGFGAISTPWFDYRIAVTHAADDATEAIWRRQVTEFRETSSLLSSEFAAVFGKLFNTVEFQPPEPIDMESFIDSIEGREDDDIGIDYDRTATWCRLTMQKIPGELSVETDCVALITHQPQLPAKLLEAYFSFRNQLTGLEGF